MPGLGHQRRLPQLGPASPVHYRTEEGPHRHHRGRLRPRPVAWNCLASDRIAGTAAFYDSPSNKLSESSLKSSAKLHYGVYGDSAGQVEAVTCTPEHLSITYKIDHLVRSGGSYLDLSFGTTTTTPGSGEYTYSFSPTVTTSADNTPQKITATVKKPAENAVPVRATENGMTEVGRFKTFARPTSVVMGAPLSSSSRRPDWRGIIHIQYRPTHLYVDETTHLTR